VPPLAALTLLLLAVLAATALFAAVGADAGPLQLAALGVVGLLAAVLLAWAGHARHIVSLRELLGAPLYVLGKIPIYARWFKARQVEWVRTKRDDRSQ